MKTKKLIQHFEEQESSNINNLSEIKAGDIFDFITGSGTSIDPCNGVTSHSSDVFWGLVGGTAQNVDYDL